MDFGGNTERAWNVDRRMCRLSVDAQTCAETLEAVREERLTRQMMVLCGNRSEWSMLGEVGEFVISKALV